VLANLSSSDGRYKAPEALAHQLAYDRYHRDALLECQADKRWKIQKIEDFFAAKPIDLAGKSHKTYLVFFASYCPPFFGAHAQPFWIMEEQANGTYKELLSDNQDEVQILDTRHNGYSDISTQYGNDEPVILRFDASLKAYR